MVKRCVLAAVLLAGAGPTAALAVPQFGNGDFEDPQINGSVVSGAGNLVDWSVGGNGVEIVSDQLWEPSSGNQSLDLSRLDAGSIEQTVNGFTVGQQYKLLFDLSGNPDSGDQIKQMRVDVAGSDAQFYFDTGTTSRSNMGWETQTFSFSAPTTDLLFEFSSLNESPYGPALDNVRLELGSGQPTDVSTPATFGLLGSALLAVGFYLRRGRSRRQLEARIGAS